MTHLLEKIVSLFIVAVLCSTCSVNARSEDRSEVKNKSAIVREFNVHRSVDGCTASNKKDSRDYMHAFSSKNDPVSISNDGRWLRLYEMEEHYNNEFLLYDLNLGVEFRISHPNNKVILSDFNFSKDVSALSFSAYIGGLLSEVFFVELEHFVVQRRGELGKGLQYPIMFQDGSVGYYEAEQDENASLLKKSRSKAILYHAVIQNPSLENYYLNIEGDNEEYRFYFDKSGEASNRARILKMYGAPFQKNSDEEYVLLFDKILQNSKLIERRNNFGAVFFKFEQECLEY